MKPLKNKKINFLGDSITQGAGASKIELSFVNLFKKLSGADIENNSIGGTRIAIQKTPSSVPIFDTYFASRILEMRNDADYVVVFGGTNDFGHGDAPLGKMGDTIPDTFYGALYDLYTKLYKKYPSSRIVAITPLHRLTENNTVNEIGLQCKPLIAYVKAIKETAELFSIPVLDLFATCNMNPNIPELNERFFFDGLHPSDAGHKRIAEMLYNFLLSI